MPDVCATYSDDIDVLHLRVAEGAEAAVVRVTPVVTAEYSASGELIGIEFLNALKLMPDFDRMSPSTAEMIHLLRSSANARKLAGALAQSRRGEGIAQTPDELRREMGL